MSHQTVDNITELGLDEISTCNELSDGYCQSPGIMIRGPDVPYRNKSNASSSAVFEKCHVRIRAETWTFLTVVYLGFLQSL